MEIKLIDPRALVDNPDKARRSKPSPQSDALLLATIRAVGIVQPPVVAPQADGGNGFVIQHGHRRVKQAIAAGLEEIAIIVDEAAADGGAMRSMVENTARENLNPVDQWRAIERLVALGRTEDAIGIALSQPVRQIKRLRLLANVLPAMLDHMAKGDMPDERQLRTIAGASLEDQKEVWKAHKPTKGDPQVDWWRVAQGLAKTRMYARDASFGDDLAQAYGIAWVEDLFAPADQDSRYTTDVDAFLGAQQEWMTQNLPKKGVIAEISNYGEVKLPPKAERVYGTPKKSDHTAMYLDREGKVKTVHFRMPEAKKKGKDSTGSGGDDEAIVVSRPRPDVTRKGIEMIGDLRTDALHEALSRAPIEDDTLLALLVLAFAGQNVRVDSGAGGDYRFGSRFGRHAAGLFDAEGKFAVDTHTLRVAARGVLVDVFSCREGMSKSGIVALVAGGAVGADSFLANMGTEDFLSCLSRPALESSCIDTPVLPRARVKDTRAALVEHFKEGHFVHKAALFAPVPTASLNGSARTPFRKRRTTAHPPSRTSSMARCRWRQPTTSSTKTCSRRAIARPPSKSHLAFERSAAAGFARRRFCFHPQHLEDDMSAHSILEHAPIGAIVAWSDGTPRPPERHRRKLDAWKTNNSQGRLIRKQGALGTGVVDPHASFTLHEADYGAGGVIAIRVHRTFSLASSLRFAIVERPAVGSVRVFDRAGDHAELVHLAPHRAAAEQWLSEHGYPNAMLEEVSAGEAGRATA